LRPLKFKLRFWDSKKIIQQQFENYEMLSEDIFSGFVSLLNECTMLPYRKMVLLWKEKKIIIFEVISKYHRLSMFDSFIISKKISNFGK
jgi:hypothetical protein